MNKSVATTTQVMHTPRCCPTGRGDGPCPPPRNVTVRATKQLIEQVELTSGGKVVSTRERWSQPQAEMVQEPYCGRRPEGLHRDGDACTDADDVGAHFAMMAELEAASVPAFERLARELAAHGAPNELVHRAHLAMQDEIRHARVMTALAARNGAAPREITVPELPCRTLDAIARENVIEGCVREAYGALVATYQAERAAPALRAAFDAIAADERQHAALSEDVHAWIVTQLSTTARVALDEARRGAEAELRASLSFAPACAELGFPARGDATALFDAYFAPTCRGVSAPDYVETLAGEP